MQFQGQHRHGNVEIAGTTDMTSDLRVNTDKFTVAAATGNVVAKGTLDVDGNVQILGTTDMSDDLKVNTDKFTVAADTGNVEIAGILALTADSGHPLTVNVDKLIVAYDGSILSAGTIATSGILSVVKDGSNMFTVYSDTGNVEVGRHQRGRALGRRLNRPGHRDACEPRPAHGTIVGTMQTQEGPHKRLCMDGNLIAGKHQSMSSVQVFNDEDVQYTQPAVRLQQASRAASRRPVIAARRTSRPSPRSRRMAGSRLSPRAWGDLRSPLRTRYSRFRRRLHPQPCRVLLWRGERVCSL